MFQGLIEAEKTVSQNSHFFSYQSFHIRSTVKIHDTDIHFNSRLNPSTTAFNAFILQYEWIVARV